MPIRKVPHRRRLAIEDVADHSNRIAESNLDAALRFLDAIESTVELLCRFPEAGGLVPTSCPEAQGLRAKLVAMDRSEKNATFRVRETQGFVGRFGTPMLHFLWDGP